MATEKGRARRERVEASPLGIIRAVSLRLHSRATLEWAERWTPAFLLALVDADAPLPRPMSAAVALGDDRRASALATIAERLALHEHPRATAVAVAAARATNAHNAEQLLRLLQSFGPQPSLLRAVYAANRQIDRDPTPMSSHHLWHGAVLAWLSVTGEPDSTPDELRAWADRAAEDLESAPAASAQRGNEPFARAALCAGIAQYEARFGDRATALRRFEEGLDSATRAARVMFDDGDSRPSELDGYCVAHRALVAAARALDRSDACDALPWCANGGAVLSVAPSFETVRRALESDQAETDSVLLSASPLCFIVERAEQREALRSRAKSQLDPERVEALWDDGLITDDERVAALVSRARIDAVEGRKDEARLALDGLDAEERARFAPSMAAFEAAVEALREGRAPPLAPLSTVVEARYRASSVEQVLEKWGDLSKSSSATFSAARSAATALLWKAIVLAEQGRTQEARSLVDAVQKPMEDRADPRSRLVNASRLTSASLAAKLALGELDSALLVAITSAGDAQVARCAAHLASAFAEASRGEAAVTALRVIVESPYVTFEGMVAAFAGAARLVSDGDRADALVAAERALSSLRTWLAARE